MNGVQQPLPFNSARAVLYGQFLYAAYKMYESAPQNATPPPVALPTDYKFVAWIQMRDFIITRTNWTFYGLLAQCISKPSEHVLVIRGTENLIEWWDDITSAVAVPLSGFGEVAYGFQRIYETLRVIHCAPPKIAGARYTARSLESAGSFAHQVAAAVHATLGVAATPSPETSIEVTGHSLGAALATLYVAENSQSAKLTTPLICTFASPRVGDSVFKAQFDNLGITSWRIVNELDVVPKLPFLGYWHVEKEEAYNSGPSVDWTLGCWHSLNTYLHLIDPNQPLSPDCRWPQTPTATLTLNSERRSANAPLLQAGKDIAVSVPEHGTTININIKVS
jgi:hypothetical protein